MAIGLVAHDEKKQELLKWVSEHEKYFSKVEIFATGTTGKMISSACRDLDITCLKSGPHGGDQQLGSLIADGRLKALIFFVDPLSPHPHDVDVKALLRLATLYNVPLACNSATAELLLPILAD